MLLTKKDTAKRLGISPPTVDRLVRDGELTAVEFYGRRRYPEESVEACLKAHTIKPRPKMVFPDVVYTPGMKLV